jgi:hypothetical protein
MPEGTLMSSTLRRYAATRSGVAIALGLVWLLPLHALETTPSDVTVFIEQRTLCDHFRAEPWPEGAAAEERERRAFLSMQMERYCEGTDEKLRLLRERYRDNREVFRQLDQFENSIETK